MIKELIILSTIYARRTRRKHLVRRVCHWREVESPASATGRPHVILATLASVRLLGSSRACCAQRTTQRIPPILRPASPATLMR